MPFLSAETCMLSAHNPTHNAICFVGPALRLAVPACLVICCKPIRAVPCASRVQPKLKSSGR
jgi:hypothetical protein